MTVSVLWLFLAVPWFGLQYVIVVFSDHTHFSSYKKLSVTSFVDHFVLFMSCVCLASRLFIAALRSPEGRGLTSWLHLL